MSDHTVSSMEIMGANTGRFSATGIMFGIANRFERGRIAWVLPEGRTVVTGKRRFDDPSDVGTDVTVHLYNYSVARKLLFGGNNGIGMAYVEGDYECSDLALFLTICATNVEALETTLRGSALYRYALRVMHLLNRNSEKGSKRNILFHYDLGNSFYERWLDPTMTYSSAEFLSESEDLQTAQHNKYERLAERLEVNDAHHILEIGCGWGGFAEHVAKTRGAKVTALTISDAQHDYAAERIHRAGLSEKVDVVKRDYRHEDGKYDRIASIEMFEAVGEKYWPVYFETVAERLKDAGRAALQVITIDDIHFDSYRSRPDFIQSQIFPGGMLPSPTALKEQIAKAGLAIKEYETFGLSYARTLSEWNDRFQTAWSDIAMLPSDSAGGGKGFDARFKRMWEYYLAYCEAGFRAGTIDVCRVTINKP